jgi:hypothetical protein
MCGDLPVTRWLRRRAQRGPTGQEEVALPELDESAEVDGASRLQIFFKIVSMTALPGYASTGILVLSRWGAQRVRVSPLIESPSGESTSGKGSGGSDSPPSTISPPSVVPDTGL